ncbi:cytochrome P450 [Sphingomonas sp. 35-24ZXX]|uniref:cytochrome P450 n=1 Tax=Sphingomonas sp. 35-24ZXX TaxID=1545915 RepID=UPI00053BEB67|nr:cytochrome P450 [Sphingomonas sp. 35-24ZXX]
MNATVTSPTLDDALADSRTYADDRAFHALLTRLRHEDPVHWTQPEGYRPFWTITRHADIMEIEKQAERFVSAPRTALRSAEAEEQIRRRTGSVQPIRSLIQMDAPDHRHFRGLTQTWFGPKRLKELDESIGEIADSFIDKMTQLDGECDFAADIAVWFPLRVVMLILGVPEEDLGLMLKLTQQHFAASDPSVAAEGKVEAGAAASELFQYFNVLTAERRKNPRNDIVSLLADATVNDAPISDFDRNSYYFLLAVAGHDTTSSSISGLMHALAENPDQRERLTADPDLLPKAIEEGIRWTSPVRHFFRTATEDCLLRGCEIKAGDSLMLSYPSANRDEDVFDDPFAFRIDRAPNPHLAFGYGPHLCLGQHLAKMEMRALFAKLLPRIESLEISGEPRWLETNFVGGLKSLPIRYLMHR